MSNYNSETDRILNPEIKSYTYRFVQEALKRNPLFEKVFGKNYVKNRIKESIKTVYTNETPSAKGYIGYHTFNDDITLCLTSEDNGLLRPEDIEKNSDYQELLLHEAVHAIFKRTKKECKKMKVECATGLLEVRTIPEIKGWIETGRGLNEGFTEWVCERIGGYETKSYSELTNYIRLLELAVGTEKVLELGKGDIYKRMPSILGIDNKSDLNGLIASSDALYNLNSELLTNKIICELLEYREDNKEKSSPEYDKKYEISKNEIEELRNDKDFLDYINKNNLDDSDKSILKFLKEHKFKELVKRQQTEMVYFESKVLDLYFAKDLEKIFSKEGPIDDDDYKKVSQITSLLNADLMLVPDSLKEEPKLSCVRIKEEFAKFQEKYIKQAEKYINQVAIKESKRYVAGEISIKDVIEETAMMRKYKFGLNNDLPLKFFKEFSKQVDPDFSNNILKMILRFVDCLLEKDDNFKKFEGAKMYKLVSQDKSIDTVITFSQDNFYNNYFESGHYVNENSIKFDFTVDNDIDNEYAMAMQGYLKLRQEILEKNPNSKFYISSRTIIVQDGDNNNSFYYIYKGQIVPMTIEKEHKVSLFSKENEKKEENNVTDIIPVKTGRFTNFINRVRKKLYELRTGKSQEKLEESQINGVPGKIEFSTNEKEKTVIDSYRVEDFNERLEVARESKSIESIEQRSEDNRKNDGNNR